MDPAQQRRAAAQLHPRTGADRRRAGQADRRTAGERISIGFPARQGHSDRHFPEGARALGLAGAEIVFNPSATVAGLSEYLWKLEQPAHAVANGYFVGAINRVGTEAPWNIGEFYGQSYFCDPRGRIFSQACRDKDEVLTADLDLDMIAEVRKTWQFFRDRRPDMYGSLVKA